MSQYEQLYIENQLCHPIYSASNALQRLYKPYLKPLNLTYPQYLVMLSLWQKDQVRFQQVSQQTYFDSGSLTPLIQKLEKKNLIEIGIDPQDARGKLIKLTKKGRNLQEKAKDIPKDILCFLPMQAKELQNLRNLIKLFHQQLLQIEKSKSK